LNSRCSSAGGAHTATVATEAPAFLAPATIKCGAPRFRAWRYEVQILPRDLNLRSTPLMNSVKRVRWSPSTDADSDTTKSQTIIEAIITARWRRRIEARSPSGLHATGPFNADPSRVWVALGVEHALDLVVNIDEFVGVPAECAAATPGGVLLRAQTPSVNEIPVRGQSSPSRVTTHWSLAKTTSVGFGASAGRHASFCSAPWSDSLLHILQRCRAIRLP
jgi:hypothetical protein